MFINFILPILLIILSIILKHFIIYGKNFPFLSTTEIKYNVLESFITIILLLWVSVGIVSYFYSNLP